MYNLCKTSANYVMILKKYVIHDDDDKISLYRICLVLSYALSLTYEYT